jgi:hypothetical protein
LAQVVYAFLGVQVGLRVDWTDPKTSKHAVSEKRTASICREKVVQEILSEIIQDAP